VRPWLPIRTDLKVPYINQWRKPIWSRAEYSSRPFHIMLGLTASLAQWRSGSALRLNTERP